MPEQPPRSLHALEKRYTMLETRKNSDGTEHWLNWVIFDRGAQSPLGTFQATVRDDAPSDIAYIIFSAHWRKGIAREAGAGAVDPLFNPYPTPTLAPHKDTRKDASMKPVRAPRLTPTAFL